MLPNVCRACYERRPRLKMPKLETAERVADFREVELGFSEDGARSEAERCLRCDLET